MSTDLIGKAAAPPAFLNRRHFLAQSGLGAGGIALAWLLHREGMLASPVEMELRHYDLLPKKPPLAPRAQAMISLFMNGGPSHIDLFDPKPLLNRLNGEKFPGEIKHDNAQEASMKIFGSPFEFKKRGQSGIEASELLPGFAEIVDDVTLIRSMHTGVNNHGQSTYALQTGRILSGRPVLGSWLAYGLGTENQNLPAFVALNDARGYPVEGVHNWSCGWLPSIYQGTAVRSKEPRIVNLEPPPQLRGEVQNAFLNYVGKLNRSYSQSHPQEQELEARIASYGLAARMQLSATEALDITDESEATKKLYGLDNPVTREFGTRCLIARRLVERGVRFVQLYVPAWDHHNSIIKGLAAACAGVDLPSAALVKDLKSRGLLDSTVVHWGGEMGRMPVIQNDTGREKIGRDHNTYGFSMWVTGGGFQRGLAFGETDEFGLHAVKDVVHHFDYHATLLHLFGLDAAKLTYRHNNQDLSILDGQPGQVMSGMLM